MNSHVTTDSQSITIGEKRYPLIVRKHRRAKQLILRYDAKRACVKLTLPRHVSYATGMAFAQSKQEWLSRQLTHESLVPFAHGAIIPLFGHAMTLVHAGGRGVVTREQDQLFVPGAELFMARRVRDYIYKELAKELRQRASQHAQMLGVSFSSLHLRDTSSRWGSCSSSGGLSFCWRLALAPLEVMDYVVCHEVAHLRHHHHGPHFWNVVAQLCPTYEQHETWLRQHGKTLWRYG